MTREDIEQLNVVEPYCFETDSEEIWYQIGCIEGLNAADKEPNTSALWHDASEEPKCKRLLIIYRDDIGCIPIDTLIYHGDADCHWKELAKRYNIIYWAYAKDILPKGVER